MILLSVACGRHAASRDASQAEGPELASAEAAEAAAVGNHFARAVVPRGAGDAAARMRTGAAHVEALQWSAVGGVAEHGPRRPQLVERHGAVHDVAADKPELAFEAL